MDEGQELAGRYRLEGRLARGGQADVWAAQDDRLQRSVAVKAARTTDPECAARLEREARLLAQLDHPGVVRLLDAGTVDDQPFLVLELVEGPSLQAQLTASGPRSEDEVTTVGATLAGALAQAHDRGIVHRDVKPGNVLLEPDGRAKLADFGIARTDDATSLTKPGLSVGSVAYVSPEQLRGDSVGPASDVYSLGLVLIEALSGQPAFPGDVVSAARERLERPPDVPAETSGPLAALLTEMTQVDPSERPEAVVVAAELAQLMPVPETETDHTAKADVIPPVVRPRVRRRALIAAAAAIVAVTAVAGAALSGGGSPASDPATQQEPPTTVTPSSTTPGAPTTVASESTGDTVPAEPTDPATVVAEGSGADEAPVVEDPVVEEPDDGGGAGEVPEPQDPPTTDTTVASPTAESNST